MKVISPLIEFQQQLRIFHWQTNSYAAHKAFGKAYEAMDDLVDRFVETYMGINGRIKPTTVFNFSLQSSTSGEVIGLVLNNFEEYLLSMNEEIPNNTDLLNIRDEMLGTVNKLRYLLSLQ